MSLASLSGSVLCCLLTYWLIKTKLHLPQRKQQWDISLKSRLIALAGDLISINWIKMSKPGPSRGAETDWKVRQNDSVRSAVSSLLEELLIRGRTWKPAPLKKGGWILGRRGNDAPSRVRARGRLGGKDDNEGTREKVMQSFLAASCWFPVALHRFGPHSISIQAVAPRCVPRGPRPSYDSLRDA